MGYITKAGSTGSVAEGGGFDNLGTSGSSSYPVSAAADAAAANISATEAAASAAAALASANGGDISEAAALGASASSAASAAAALISANNADISEAAALASQVSATASASSATTSANNADISEAAALASQVSATSSATSADTSEAAAVASATAAAASASSALTSANNSDTSEAAALASQVSAASSALSATTSANNADISEAAAFASQVSSSALASSSATSAASALSSANNADTSEAAALASQTSATASASSADTSEAAALASANAAAVSAALAVAYVPTLSGNAGKYLKTDGASTAWDAIDISTADVSGTLPVTNGGTGATTAVDARANLSAAIIGPNNDITSLSTLGGGITTPSYIDLALGTPVSGGMAGRLKWNATDATADLGVSDGTVTLQVGQESHVRVLNVTGSTIFNPSVVRINGSSGSRATIALALANLEANTLNTVGVATQDIPDNMEGMVTSFGLVRNINTSAFLPGDQLYLSAVTPGALVNVAPSGSYQVARVGICVRSHATLGSIFVSGQVEPTLDALSGVSFSGLADNNLIQYNSTASAWENVAGPVGEVVGTTDTQTLTNKSISGSSNTITNIANAALTNSSFVLGTTAISLGSTQLTPAGLTSVTVTQDPTSAFQLATKGYVDSVAAGLAIKTACRLATTVNDNLTGGASIDGINANNGDRILVKNQTTVSENGIYIVGGGAWTRATDFDIYSEVPGATVFISEGNTLAATTWVCTAGLTGTINVTAIPWTQFGAGQTYSAGTGLDLDGNTFSIFDTGVTPGTYGSASTSSALLINSKGQVIAAASVPIAANAFSVTGTTLAPNVVTSSLTGVGTITSGVWNGTTVAVTSGGTGAISASGARANLSAAQSGTNGDILSLTSLSGGITTPTYVDFDQVTVGANAAGRLRWNVSEGTLNLGMGGGEVTQQIGLESFILVYNNTGSTILDKSVVRVTGATGLLPTVELAKADTLVNSKNVVGLTTQNIATGQQGYVTVLGLIRNVDTSAFVTGDPLYLSQSTFGAITSVVPPNGNQVIRVGTCINSHVSGGSILVSTSFERTMDGLSDVSATSPSDNDMLKYNASLSQWEKVGGPAGAVVGTTDTQTITNKTISGASNTLVNVPPAVVSDAVNTSTGYFDIPVGTTAQRPGSPNAGQIRYNTDTPGFEGYGATWGALGGGNTTNRAFWQNSATINDAQSIDSGSHGTSTGPITIGAGGSMTVPTGSNWAIL